MGRRATRRPILYLALLWLVAAAPPAGAAATTSVGLLSAGLSEALNRLAAVVDTPYRPGSGGNLFSGGFEVLAPNRLAPPTWSVALAAAGGDLASPAVLLSNGGAATMGAQTTSQAANGDPARVVLS